MAKQNRSAEKEAFWRLALEEFHRSGLTVRSYCRQEGLSEPSFYAWRKAIQQRDAGAESAPSALVPVQVVNAIDESPIGSTVAPSLEVLTPAGFTLRFPQELSPQQLAAFLGVISRQGATPC